jgi:hypothetical protein
MAQGEETRYRQVSPRAGPQHAAAEMTCTYAFRLNNALGVLVPGKGGALTAGYKTRAKARWRVSRFEGEARGSVL